MQSTEPSSDGPQMDFRLGGTRSVSSSCATEPAALAPRGVTALSAARQWSSQVHAKPWRMRGRFARRSQQYRPSL